MEESSRNSFNNLEQNNNSGGSYGSQGEDDKKLSPRSLEQVKEIGTGILQLVDDFDNHQHDEVEIQKHMDNLNIGSEKFVPTGQHSQNQAIKQNQNVHLQRFGPNYSQQPELTGGTPFFPNYIQDTQERIQGMVQGVGDFQQPFQHKKGAYSRQSSEGENGLTGNAVYHRLDYSEVAVHSGHKHEDNYSNKSWIDSTSDYQEHLEKFGYIYSPDQQYQRPQQIHHNGNYNQSYNQGFQNQGYYQQRPTQQQWDSYHQNFKPQVGFQNRASSHDKLAQQNNNYQPFVQHNFGINNNEELETHSAASSGNHSAFSEGDIYNPAFQNPNNYNQQYYQGQPYMGGPPSNQAMYGFTPNIQFSGSNQKYHPQSSAGISMKFPTDQTIGSYEIFPDEINLQAQSSQNDIQITDLDVNLQGFKIGVSPRKNSNELKSHSVQKMPQGGVPGQQFLGTQHYDSYSERNAHHHNQIHSQYKTPSPYRNSDMGINAQFQLQQAMHHQQQQSMNNSTKGLRIAPNHSEPFYPGYNFQNQRIAQQVYNKQPMYHGGARGQMNDQYSHIGMNAPPILRNIEFPHGESLIMNHNRPFPAVQTNYNPHQIFYPAQQQYPIHPSNQQLAMKNLISSKNTGSQERDPNYQPLNFLPSQGQNSKTVVNTPKNNPSQEHNKSVSSANSNNSQQFSTVITDQNEAFLLQITKQFDECQNPQQKLDTIKGYVHKLALNQKGSRFLQRQVTKATSNVITFLLDEISPHFKELMTDNYGNYFCQCLLQSCSGDQRLQILKSIETYFIEICCNSKGTHAIQKMFDLVNLPEEEDFIRNALLGNVMKLSIDPQGTHVVQKVLASFEEQKRAFIFEEIYDQFIELAKNTNGLCVIKKLILFTKEKSQSDALMQKIQENSNALAQDMYGNYAITEIINNWDPEVCKPIFNALKPKVIQLCNQKYSSNVIEKCLEKADENIRSQFIQEMSSSDKLTNTIRNQYGNFVIQKALKIAQGPDKEQLIQAIKRCIPEIQDKRIREKWERIIFDAINGTNSAIQSSQGDQLENDTNSTGGGSTGHRQVTINQNNLRSNSNDNVQ